MANIIPTDIYAGYKLLAAADPAPSQGIFIPLASLPTLNTEEANAETGDGRAIIHSLVEQAYTSIQALATTARPNRLSVTKANPNGVGIGLVNQSYGITVTLGLDNSTNVATEA